MIVLASVIRDPLDGGEGHGRSLYKIRLVRELLSHDGLGLAIVAALSAPKHPYDPAGQFGGGPVLLLRILNLITILHLTADLIDMRALFVELENERWIFRERDAVGMRELFIILGHLLDVTVARAVSLAHRYRYHLFLGEPGSEGRKMSVEILRR